MPLLSLTVGPSHAELAIELDDRLAAIEAGDQRVEFRLNATGAVLAPVTYVGPADARQPVFGGTLPLVVGSVFDLAPTECRISDDTPWRKALSLRGRSALHGYEWECRVEASDATPLLHFVITIHLPDGLSLPEPQPTVAMWMPGAADAVTVGQGPESIYGPDAPILGFPAAYLWHAGAEAVVFFDMTPMTWMSRGGVDRFLDCRVDGRERDGSLGLGLHTWKLTGNTIPPGDMVLSLYLYEARRPARPTKLEALDTLARACAPLHPASAPSIAWPGGSPPPWGQIAAGTLRDLMIPGVTYEEQEAGWRDAPLELVPPVDRMVVHPDRPRPPSAEGPMPWDFSTVNNHLSAWILYNRLRPDEPLGPELVLRKKDALPLFYDPETRLIRWGTRTPPHVAGPDMAWQCLFFHHETMRVYDALPPEAFSPAIAGRFLMATRGLTALAHNTQYVIPQWFDPERKVPSVQHDVPELGAVREPWQVGTYAHLMLRAHEVSGDPAYLAEAQASLRALFEPMSYSISNDRYERTYADPADFPITEIHGNALGIVAAYRLYEQTGNAVFAQYSRAFLNSLLRMTFWYDDQTDAPSRSLSNLGLFLPFGGACSATPWETCEAHLALAWILKHDTQMPDDVRELLLRLSNLHRRSALLFYPPTWPDAVRELDPGATHEAWPYLPTEPFYSLEGGGHRGAPAAYMAGSAVWCYWLYEALARSTDPDVLVLNLDVHEGFEEALAGHERHVYLYNPTPEPRDVDVTFPGLPAGVYALTVEGAAPSTAQHSSDELGTGVPIRLAARAWAPLTLHREDSAEARDRIAACKQARNALSRAYQLLQEAALSGATPAPSVELFGRAMEGYRRGDFGRARLMAQDSAKGLGP